MKEFNNTPCNEAVAVAPIASETISNKLNDEVEMLRKLNGELNNILDFLYCGADKNETEMDITCMADAVTSICRETEKALSKVGRIRNGL